MTEDEQAAGGESAPSLRWFAANSYGDSSPIYRAVVEAMADDQDLRRVIADAPDDARHPGVLLAAVKYLVARGADDRLARLYAEGVVEGVADAFRSFVLDHRREVLDIMAVRRLQTNEIARTAILAPAVREIQRRAGQPVSLIDVGTSAGLNLLLDSVHIDYGHSTLGPTDSPLHLVCTTHDDGPPPGPELDVRWRVGLDREPVDLTDPDARRWLEACIWPEHTERSDRLAAAARLQARRPPRLVRGDGVDSLMPLIGEAPTDTMLVIMTSWTAVYLSGPRRGAFERTMAAAGRPIVWLSVEFPGVVRGIEPPRSPRTDAIDLSHVATVRYGGEGRTESRDFMAWSDNHGAWLDWPLGESA